MLRADPSLFTRLCFRLVLLCLLPVTASLWLIHSPTDDDSSLRTFLIPPPGCTAPCFMGIRLGVTTLDDALARLKVNPLLLSVTNFSPGRYDLEFVQPFASTRSTRMPILLEAQHGIIERINLYDPGIPLSRLVLVLGQPAQLILNDTLRRGFVTYVAFYPQYLIYIEADLPLCSLDVSSFWKSPQPGAIGIETASKYAQQSRYYGTYAQENGETWLQQLLAMKHIHCA